MPYMLQKLLKKWKSILQPNPSLLEMELQELHTCMWDIGMTDRRYITEYHCKGLVLAAADYYAGSVSFLAWIDFRADCFQMLLQVLLHAMINSSIIYGNIC